MAQLRRRRAPCRRPRSGTRRCGTPSPCPGHRRARCGTTLVTSSADSQLMIAPSPSRPASRSIPSRNAATRIGGCTSGTRPRRKPCTSNVSYFWVDLLPRQRGPQEAHHVAHRLYGSTNGTPFHRSTITFDDVPMPKANRPGAATQRRDGLRHHAGARVNAGTIAVPRRNAGAHCDARSNGVNVSPASDSADHTPCSRGRRALRTWRVAHGEGPRRGTVMPGRMGKVMAPDASAAPRTPLRIARCTRRRPAPTGHAPAVAASSGWPTSNVCSHRAV